MSILDKLHHHKEKRNYLKLLREVGKKDEQWGSGYILDLSNELILLQVLHDFHIIGYEIVPVKVIKKIQRNRRDKFYDKAFRGEQDYQNLGIAYNVDLENWRSAFESISKRNLNVIVECENWDEYPFNIGPIKKIGTKNLHVLYLNAEGIYEDKPTKIPYDAITKIQFDNRYINIMSKNSIMAETI